MWIVRLALRRPYTFVVAAMLVMILGLLFIFGPPSMGGMATDIFPEVKIPVIAVAFNYTGMSPQDMNLRIVGPFERILTTTVNDIEHVESQSLNGIGVIKIYFQKNAKIEVAIAQVTAISQTATRITPPGTQPPLIIQYNAADVPIVQLSVGSDTVPEQQLFDIAINTVRLGLINIPGLQSPYPYGGKQRNVIVDLVPEKMYGLGVSPADVSDAIGNQNLILPSGSAKIGTQEYQVVLNSSPTAAEGMNALPIKTVNGTTVYIKDVANVRDGFSVQTNIVHSEGKRSVLISVLKSGSASTLDVVDAVKAALPQLRKSVPDGVTITPVFDQSVFVRASIEGVVKEAAIAAGLTALMILLFLGSWRSTLIVLVSIPLSILVSIICLNFMGETLNVMTLGGMALAVGILVDDATVEIENIHRNLHMKKKLVHAILDGASQIAVPAFVSTLCICIVFVPVVFISGAAKYLFTPLSMAVVFAMMTSYLLSRTLTPTMVHYLLPNEVERYGGVIDEDDPHTREKGGGKGWKIFGMVLVALVVVTIGTLYVPGTGGIGFLKGGHAWVTTHTSFLIEATLGLVAIVIVAWLMLAAHDKFNQGFEWLRRIYGGLLEWCLHHRVFVSGLFVLLVAISFCIFPFIGRDFFPTVDAGQLRLHVRAPAGTRIEETELRFGEVEAAIRKMIPANELGNVLDNIGIPNSSINLSLSDGTQMSPADGEILVSLKGEHRPTAEYMRMLRQELPKQFEDMTFFFAPSDIVTQVLNFGLSAPVDVQFAGPVSNVAKNGELAELFRQEASQIPGVVDVHLQQVAATPDIRVNVDRTLASQLGVTQKDVASDLLISLSSSNQTAPNFWVDPKSGISYSVFVQTPQYYMNTINELDNTPIVPSGALRMPDDTQLLTNLASTARNVSATNITDFNAKPTYDVLMGVQGTDLGTVEKAVRQLVDKYNKLLPARDLPLVLRGQIQSMDESFSGLGFGLIFAVMLVYLLMVINFQSWLDPLIILMALPGAASGILWMLWASNTTLSVPALMGAIMSIGVATANSILLITFANDQREMGMDSHQAALSAGITRLRPVMMTALAMIIGMLPMALGLGEGGEQNAPLGRAVIGGLSVATFATLFFVPVVYSRLRIKARVTIVEQELM